ncbi:hypothetical protein [Paludisphaera borealis]|uniref:Uncharacterized protein n=1 Tax=Paludisphaera borealis TaxID=1387353 RepID=A0A1U7CXB0_9BACT|nr:hypothetical protein [Paludisphaera borealis]APW63523.1 hypothetical protein BSF38_05095 [Paludisphaera borealis]
MTSIELSIATIDMIREALNPLLHPDLHTKLRCEPTTLLRIKHKPNSIHQALYLSVPTNGKYSQIAIIEYQGDGRDLIEVELCSEKEWMPCESRGFPLVEIEQSIPTIATIINNHFDEWAGAATKHGEVWLSPWM